MMQGSDIPVTSNTRPEAGDAVRISKDQFCMTYDRAFCLWSSLHASAVECTSPLFVDLPNVFQAQPSFPRNLSLKREKIGNENRICAYGYSTWSASASRCWRHLPSFQLPARIEVASTNTVTMITEAPAAGLYKEWFHGSRNYVAILALAWSYILSARWAEVMPGPCTLIYGDEPAVTSSTENGLVEHDAIVVDIGEASSDEARWWAAILAEDQGWRATISFDGETFAAPWSVQRQRGHRFVLAANLASSPRSPSPSAPSYVDASRFLQRFCVRHDLAAQSHAALAAVLLFPSMGRGQPLRLPVSLTENPNASVRTAAQDAGSPSSLGCDWDLQDHVLDRLIMLSCYTRGLRPMLLSVFYEPSVDCNAVSAWLQGELAAIDRLSRHEPLVLGRMLMDRSPKVSFLWLGATVLGLQGTLLKEARRGQIPIDLHSAAWSGTTQTFLQLPTSSSCSAHITRADECRLLFLCQADGHNRLPLVQWKPFGATPLEDVDLEVRAHAKCIRHKLHYEDFNWVVRDDTGLRLWAEWLSRLWCRVRLRISSLWVRHKKDQERTYEKDQGSGISKMYISHEEMDQAKEVISENATRNIFTWLRPNGWSRHERKIWRNEWFTDLESEDETEESGLVVADKSSTTALWISKLPSA
ncbi:immunoglobulin variable region used by the itc63b heavy chain [Ophiostoma piceae UAMH 11346]|uniref:Immunoglobulin variable region used by the itc63b heavy chain n=1 Tax=Ophiostoma piceae (strain UAMH 11346) TaxID=1262450 RepID=S3C7Y9_OPHP1|nr:immunoglobulin variable region used by the itc63b heavy chain [Ophiostoma piceae UAMH 11346]